MNNGNELFDVTSRGNIYAKEGINTRMLYEHQEEAIECLNIMDKEKNYSTMLVLPTGAGKTYTAAIWLMKSAINNKKKILWTAHRKLLLDQAAECFQQYAYEELIPDISSFDFRVISGYENHDRMIDIRPDDDLLIVSKDSLGRNIEALSAWLKDEDDIYLVIDEAHHSVAKTYRKIIDFVKSKVKNVKLIGLTATPCRTDKKEEGLLSKIYCDGIVGEGTNRKFVRNSSCIAYQIGLQELINRKILSHPIIEKFHTGQNFAESLGVKAVESIQNLDILPKEVEENMAKNAVRNKLIVQTYKNNQNKYGQTIVFAVNIVNAIQLASLFKKAGIKADYIVSGIKDAATGVTISKEENQQKIDKYREGKLQVLINVNILTEGIDLPKTQTVFLARPTVSSVLMTQMIGRALRGTKAGGTEGAYIVSFIDDWEDKIIWAVPDIIFDENNMFNNKKINNKKYAMSMISISKMEEFASLLDSSIDTSALEQIPFEKRIPIGMYDFTYLTEQGIDLRYPILVYDGTKKFYDNLMQSLPKIFENFNITEEYIPDNILNEIEAACSKLFFCEEMFPPYNAKDIKDIIKCFAQTGEVPKFMTFDEMERNKVDISKIAENIVNENMNINDRKNYINNKWNSEEETFKNFFGKKLFFLRQLDIELMKLLHPDVYENRKSNVVCEGKAIEELTLYQIRKKNPVFEAKLRDDAFEKSKNEKGEYQCALCGMSDINRNKFQVDHIIPMNKGGKTIPENLQILCRKCNGEKSDK